jgi:hypothetical protein
MIVILDLVDPGWLLVIEALLERASVGVLKEEGSMELRNGKKWRCRPYLPTSRTVQASTAGIILLSSSKASWALALGFLFAGRIHGI